MSVYNPDCWVILEFSTPMQKTYKVFAGWRGGYTDGDSWKLSSGITGVDWENGAFTCHNVSGSDYICALSNYGMKSGLMNDVYRGWESVLSAEPNAQMRALTRDEFSNSVFNKTAVFL